MMACYNCEDGKVALTNNDGQIYEFRTCPLCSCKVCGGNRKVYVPDDRPGYMGTYKPCNVCTPEIICKPVFNEMPLKVTPEPFFQLVEPDQKVGVIKRVFRFIVGVYKNE